MIFQERSEAKKAWIQRWRENRMKDSFRCGNCLHFVYGGCWKHDTKVTADDSCSDFYNLRILKGLSENDENWNLQNG